MAFNRWTLSYIVYFVLVIGGLLLLILNPAIPTFAASSSLYSGSTSHRLNHADSLSTTYGTATISPTSLNGLNQTLSITIPLQVVITSGTDWHMQIGLTPLASANYTLPTSLNVGLTGYCNAYNDHPYCGWHSYNNSCYLFGTHFTYYANRSINSIVALGSTPTPVTVYDDSTGCTTGNITFTTSLTASLLARNTYSGTYTNKIQASVIAGP
ncbi:MAG TPA: hypothetical protein VKR42_09645 [Ktedonobacteraceae bacterium]|nr:hypothetical protein [Ktedonobacteraceae bacterium]